MKSKWALTAVVPLVVWASPSAAEDVASGNWLLEGCRAISSDVPASGNHFKKGVCLGQIEAITFFGKTCPSKEVTTQQKAKVVVAYLDRNPAKLHQSFLWLATLALSEAWPCPSR